jgi:hypothetical protein
LASENFVVQQITKSKVAISRILDLGGNLFNVQIIPEKLHDNAIQTSRGRGKSTVNVTQCFNDLRDKGLTPPGIGLILAVTEKAEALSFYGNAKSNFKSNSVSFFVFRSDNFKQINTILCSEVLFEIPVGDNTAINMARYNELKDFDIDIYNPNHTAFTSRCFSNIDKQTNYDTTLNSRIGNYYQGKQIICLFGCKYMGITKYNAIQCSCPGSVNESASSNAVDYPLNFVSPNNQALIMCSYEAFAKTAYLKINIGMYLGVTFIVTLAILVLLCKSNVRKKYRDNIDKIVYSDCLIFKRNKHDLSEYFLKNTVANVKRFSNIPEKNAINTSSANKEQGSNIHNNANIISKLGNSTHDIEKQLPIHETQIKKDHEVDKTAAFGHHIIDSPSYDPNTTRPLNEEELDHNVINFTLSADIDKKIGVEEEVITTMKEETIANNEFTEEGKQTVPNTENIYTTEYPKEVDIDKQLLDMENGYSITLADYDSLSFSEIIRYDRRTFSRYILDEIIRRHSLISFVAKYSIIDSIAIRTIRFVFMLNMIICLNAFFYTDDYIEMRAISSNQVKLI